MKISIGTLKLIFFVMMFSIFLHFSSCLYLVIANMEEGFTADIWLSKCINIGEGDMKNFEFYICS